MNSEEKSKIVNVLSEKGANSACPRCSKNKFTLLNGYLNQIVQSEVTEDIILGGSSIPSVVVVCTNCGYMSQHALGALGLMPKLKEEK